MVREWRQFHGEALRRGVFPLHLPFAWLLDLIYAWATNGAKDEDVKQFDAKLHEPPMGKPVPADDPVWGHDAVMDTFMATMGRMGARGRKT